MAERISATNVRYAPTGESVEAELDDLLRRVQTQNDLIANLIVRLQALEAKDA